MSFSYAARFSLSLPRAPSRKRCAGRQYAAARSQIRGAEKRAYGLSRVQAMARGGATDIACHHNAGFVGRLSLLEGAGDAPPEGEVRVLLRKSPSLRALQLKNWPYMETHSEVQRTCVEAHLLPCVLHLEPVVFDADVMLAAMATFEQLEHIVLLRSKSIDDDDQKLRRSATISAMPPTRRSPPARGLLTGGASSSPPQ
ncbi:hypothetical protein FGB62_118g01 [Gracilaria domingensis]|nr:hypothetical protein FGB62_118g01 [Gracilaria domingensis]